jgi:CHAT domain-containing protein
VLSACRTASAALRSETIVRLPAAFLAAGADAVIGTFWRADDRAVYLLMTRFYELWRNGEVEPREALGDAQQWLIFARANELRKGADGRAASARGTQIAGRRTGRAALSSPLVLGRVFRRGRLTPRGRFTRCTPRGSSRRRACRRYSP